MIWFKTKTIKEYCLVYSSPTQKDISYKKNSMYSRASKVWLKLARKIKISAEEKTFNLSRSLWNISSRRNCNSISKTLTPTQSWELWCKLSLKMALLKTPIWLMNYSDKSKRRSLQMRRTQPQRNRFFWETQICIEFWKILSDRTPCKSLKKTLRLYNSQNRWLRFWSRTWKTSSRLEACLSWSNS